MGEPVPGGELEDSPATKAAIVQALDTSFTYCDEALALMRGDRAFALVSFLGEERPALGVMNFRNHHNIQHYGNVITYLRLQGIIPPSTDP